MYNVWIQRFRKFISSLKWILIRMERCLLRIYTVRFYKYLKTKCWDKLRHLCSDLVYNLFISKITKKLDYSIIHLKKKLLFYARTSRVRPLRSKFFQTNLESDEIDRWTERYVLKQYDLLPEIFFRIPENDTNSNALLYFLRRQTKFSLLKYNFFWLIIYCRIC